jgi:hypothetical protein
MNSLGQAARKSVRTLWRRKVATAQKKKSQHRAGGLFGGSWLCAIKGEEAGAYTGHAGEKVCGRHQSGLEGGEGTLLVLFART